MRPRSPISTYETIRTSPFQFSKRSMHSQKKIAKKTFFPNWCSNQKFLTKIVKFGLISCRNRMTLDQCSKWIRIFVRKEFFIRQEVLDVPQITITLRRINPTIFLLILTATIRLKILPSLFEQPFRQFRWSLRLCRKSWRTKNGWELRTRAKRETDSRTHQRM